MEHCSQRDAEDKLGRVYSIPGEEFKSGEEVLQSKHYKLGRQIGAGGYGVVYLLERTDHSTLLACKVLDLSANFVKHFRNELLVMFTCSKHPNIIDLMDQWTISDTQSHSVKAYIVMEYADRGTLGELISQQPLAEAVAREAFVQILHGLTHLHRHNIAHRDLKLDNLLLVHSDRGDVVKITDFGLAFAAYHPGEGFVESGTFAGTRLYMGPEILRIRAFKEFKKELNFDFNPFVADIWALGCCLFELLTGYLPFQNDDDQVMWSFQVAGKFSYPYFCPVSTMCRDLIAKLLDPSPQSRIDPFGIEQHAWLGKKSN